MFVGALVFDDGIRGMTAASQTLQSMHPQFSVHHGQSIGSHLAGADRVMVGLGHAAGIGAPVAMGQQQTIPGHMLLRYSGPTPACHAVDQSGKTGGRRTPVIAF